MKNLFKIVILLNAFNICHPVFSQDDTCIIESNDFALLDDYEEDSVYVIVKELDNSYIFMVCNTTSDTLYLFRSYLKDKFISSKYLRRVDIKQKTYKISFLPFLPYVYTGLGDFIFLDDKRIINDYQVKYEFVRLKPNSFYEVTLSKNKLFTEQAVRDFDINAKKNYKKIKQINHSLTIEEYKWIIEFALYSKVDLLCTHLEEFNNGNLFKDQAKSYMILKKEINKQSPR
jgi:hypothetical protein